MYGGLVAQCHNDIRDFSASLLQDVCLNVCREPLLQPLSGESLRLGSASTEDGARLDISVEGFWGHRYQRVFYVQVSAHCQCIYIFSDKRLLESLKKNSE